MKAFQIRDTVRFRHSGSVHTGIITSTSYVGHADYLMVWWDPGDGRESTNMAVAVSNVVENQGQPVVRSKP